MIPARFPLRPVGTFVLAAFTLIDLVAEPTTPATDSAPASSAYTNQPPVYVEPPYNSSSASYPSYGDSDRNLSYPDVYAFRPATIYFPPVPPPLGAPVALFRNYRSGQTETRLPQLLSHVGEFFYAPLGAHLHRADLSKKQFARLDAYTAARTALLAELRAQLTATRDADPATRARALAAFAARQAPRLAALETEAEAIRENLVSGNFLTQSGADWNDNRTWSLGDDLRYESRTDEFKVFRAAAFFTAGLSPAQRALLREFALELDEPVVDPTASLALDAPKPRFFFSPATARVDLPANLTPAIVAQVDAYTAAKTALKSELRAVVYRQDRAFFGFTRTQALRALAEAQAPRFVALEARAEDLRVALAAYPRAARPPLPALPAELTERIAANLRDAQDLRRAVLDRLAALRIEFPELRIEFIRMGGRFSIEIVADHRNPRGHQARSEACKALLLQFKAGQSLRFNALTREKEQIQTDLKAASVAQLKAPASPADIDRLKRNFYARFSQLEQWQLYRDYDTAVFEPGLSPQQRRLLFAAATVQLDLPLPGGSTQP